MSPSLFYVKVVMFRFKEHSMPLIVFNGSFCRKCSNQMSTGSPASAVVESMVNFKNVCFFLIYRNLKVSFW